MYGKNIVIVFSNGVYLRNHILMWGKWRIYDRWDFEEGKSKAPLHRKLKSQIPPTYIQHIVNDSNFNSDELYLKSQPKLEVEHPL